MIKIRNKDNKKDMIGKSQ